MEKFYEHVWKIVILDQEETVTMPAHLINMPIV